MTPEGRFLSKKKISPQPQKKIRLIFSEQTSRILGASPQGLISSELCRWLSGRNACVNDLPIQQIWIFFYLFKNFFSQFLSNCESAELVFCSDELRSLPFENQKKSMTLIDKSYKSVSSTRSPLLTNYRWFFLRLIVQFFTQIYMNCLVRS